MERYDPQLADRVWQRVQSRTTEPVTPDTLSFLQEEYVDLSRYQQLQILYPVSHKSPIQQLIQKTRHCIAILRGILYLQSDTLPEHVAYPLPKELPSASLRRLYGDTLRRSSRYAQWRSDNAYSIAFTQLETESQERCVLLLLLLGNNSDKLLAFFP